MGGCTSPRPRTIRSRFGTCPTKGSALTILIQDKRLRWPDTFAEGPDGDPLRDDLSYPGFGLIQGRRPGGSADRPVEHQTDERRRRLDDEPIGPAETEGPTCRRDPPGPRRCPSVASFSMRRRDILCGLAASSLWSPPASAAPILRSDDPRFAELVDPSARPVTLYREGRWCEGVCWAPHLGGLIVSDVRSNRMLVIGEDGGVMPFRDPSNNANGNVLDGQGRLVTCEHRTRRVVSPRIRWIDGCVGRHVWRPAIEFPQRRGARAGRCDLVHRPCLRHHRAG